jgi:hypothetical protein
MTSNDDLAAKREEARRAMEGDDRRIRRETQEAELKKKRQAAIEAMEGYERRIKREMELKALREQELLKKRMAEEKKKKEAEERLRREREEAAKRADEEERIKEREARLSRVRESEEIIEEVVSRPEAKVNAIHTIKSDIVDAAREGKLSLAKIMAREQEHNNLVYTGDAKREMITVAKKRKWSILLITLIICLTILYLSFFWQVPTTDYDTIAPRQIVTEPLVFVEEENEIDISNIESNRILQEILQKKRALPQKDNILANIYFVRSSVDDGSAAGQKKLIGLSGFLKATNIRLPAEFTKYLSEKFTLGAYKVVPPGIFFVLKVNSYENAATNLLANENGIVGSLLIPLAENSLGRDFSEKSFHDKIIRNLHTRVMTGSNGKTIAVYGFIDDRTIVIAENEETFTKVVTAYTAPRSVIR